VLGFAVATFVAAAALSTHTAPDTYPVADTATTSIATTSGDTGSDACQQDIHIAATTTPTASKVILVSASVVVVVIVVSAAATASLLLGLLLCLLLQLLRGRSDFHSHNTSADFHCGSWTQDKIDAANFCRGADSNGRCGFRIDTSRVKGRGIGLLRLVIRGIRRGWNIATTARSSWSTSTEAALIPLHKAAAARARNSADVVISGSEPIQAVLPEVIGLNLSLRHEGSRSILIGVGE